MKKERFPSKVGMLMYFMDGCKSLFAFSILFTCLFSLLELIRPKIISYTVDTVIGTEPSTLPVFINNLIDKAGGPAYLKENLWVIAAVLLISAMIGVVCRYLFKLLNAMAGERLVQRMRDTVFAHIERLPFAWFGENHTGDIIQRCTSDVETIKNFLMEMLANLFRIVIMISMALFFMADINVNLMLASAFFIPIIVGYSLVFHQKIGDSFEHVDTEEAKLSSIAQENLTGVRVVRAFGREKYERERFEVQNDSYTGEWVYLLKLLAWFWSFGDLFSYLQILTVLCYGAYLAVNGNLTAGEYIAFLSYNGMMMWPVRMLGRIISEMSKSGISIDRIREIMNAEEEHDHEVTKEADLTGDIVFDNVSYRYENGTAEVLDHVSFTIKAGTTVGILGGTGSGKSTLMYLLDRLYELPAKDGKITIGGTDIAEMKSEDIRRNIGMVLQEPYLFSRTLSENIGIAQDRVDMKGVREAARIASLEDAIDHFKEGYETFVGERGVTLSGGQKQRTAIAQMLIRKTPIMIFDDSLSAVDAETDAKIRAALNENNKDTTVILIAHRITTLMNADQIIVMDHGKVAEIGNHEELLAQNGIYKKIYDLQLQQSEV